MNRQNIEYYIASRIFPWLFLVVAIIAMILVIVAKQVVDHQLEEVHTAKIENFHKNYNRNINIIRHQAKNIARNDLIINSLIDPEGRENYIPLFLRSFAFSGVDVAHIAIVNFAGEIVTSNELPAPRLDISKDKWHRRVLEEGMSYMAMNRRGMFVVEPIIFASSAEGAVVVKIAIAQLQNIFGYAASEDLLFVTDEDGVVIFSSNTEYSPLFEKINEENILGMYSLHRKMDNGFQVVSMESNRDAYGRIYFFVVFIVFSVATIFLGFVLVVFMSSRLLSNIMNEFMSNLKKIKLGAGVLNEDVSVSYPEEFLKISREFLSLSKDLHNNKKIKQNIQSILNSLNEYLIVFDRQKNVKLTNNNFEQIGEVLGCVDKNAFDKIIPDYMKDKALDMEVHLDDFEVSYDLNFGDHFRRYKTTYIIRWSRSLYHSEKGELEGVIFVGTNITHSKQIEKDLYLKNIAIEEASNGIVIADVSKPYVPLVYANKAFLDMTGYSLDEVIGKNCRYLQGENTDKNAIARIRHAVKNRKRIVETIKNYRKDGAEFYNQLILTPIKYDSDEVTHILGVQMDVTEKVRVNEDLLEAKEKAEESAKLKSEFLASMSHEIRTPMNGVIGMLGLLQRTKLTDQQKHYAELANNSASSLLRLINDILDFSKIEAGKLELELIEFNIMDMFSDTIDALAQRANEKNIALVLDVKDIEVPVVKGDPGRIRQVLTNLIGNAIKFTQNGSIVIRANIADIENGVRTLSCSVSDTGIGIPEEKVKTLFDSFSQVDASTTRKFGGTGLGLAIVKQLCELMGGDVSVDSQLGVGSAFTFNVRLLSASSSLVDIPDCVSDKKIIFVVSVNNIIREAMCSQLSKWGFSVTEDEDITALLEKTSTLGDDGFSMAIISERILSEYNGDLVRSIRNDQRFSQMHVVVMLDTDQSYDENYYSSLGFSAVFSKPVTPKKLRSILQVLNHEIDEKVMAVDQLIESETTLPVISKADARILLVEDNVVNQQVALGVLEALGYSADLANNGIEAVVALSSAPEDARYDLILMDCQMPEMDGYDAARAIRAGKAPNPDIPIVAMTANAMKGDKEKCLNAGMNDYLSKPIDPGKLLAALHRWLGDKQNVETTNSSQSTASEADDNDIWDQEGFMRRVLNNNTIANKVIDLFKTDTPKTIEQLEVAINQNEVEKVGMIAHKLKGSVANLGGIALAVLAQRIEKAGKNNDIEEIKELWPNLKPQFDRLVLLIERRHQS